MAARKTRDQLSAEVTAFLAAIGAFESSGYRSVKGMYEVCGVGRYGTASVRFTPDMMDVQNTFTRILQASYDCGVTVGKEDGGAAAKAAIRAALGIGERSTDGHSRTAIVED